MRECVGKWASTARAETPPQGGIHLFNRRLWVSLVLWGALWSAASSTLLAHTFHVSLAEGQWNEQSQRLEVALRTLPGDLERSLSDAHQRHITLEKEAQLDRLIAEHLRQVFIVRDPSGQERAHHWVGKELKPEEIWLYFEVDLPNGLEGSELEFTLLLKQEAHQVNTLNLRQGNQRATLTFLRGQETQSVAFP